MSQHNAAQQLIELREKHARHKAKGAALAVDDNSTMKAGGRARKDKLFEERTPWEKDDACGMRLFLIPLRKPVV